MSSFRVFETPILVFGQETVFGVYERRPNRCWVSFLDVGPGLRCVVINDGENDGPIFLPDLGEICHKPREKFGVQ